MSLRILIVDNCHPVLVEKFLSSGFTVDCEEDISPAKATEIIPSYQGLIIRSKFLIDKQFIDIAKELKFIGRVGAGLENIDVEYCMQKGIKCFNSPEGNRDSVGEHALGMLLSLMNNLVVSNQEVRSGIWNREKNWGIELNDKTVGIIGFGNTGSTFSKKLSGFEPEILAYDKYKKGFSNGFVRESNMEEIFERSDILSLHVPLTSETRYLVNEDFLKRFKKNIYLINTSRGKVVETTALVKSIESGKVKGAALDVLEYENVSFEDLIHGKQYPAFNYLVNSDKVLLSPHVAGWTAESYYKTSAILADKIIIEQSGKIKN